MQWLFFEKGKPEDVFKKLLRDAILEAKFGRLIEQLEPEDFGKN